MLDEPRRPLESWVQMERIRLPEECVREVGDITRELGCDRFAAQGIRRRPVELREAQDLDRERLQVWRITRAPLGTVHPDGDLERQGGAH